MHLRINQAARWWSQAKVHQELSDGLLGPEDDEEQKVPGVREGPAIECDGDEDHSESSQGGQGKGGEGGGAYPKVKYDPHPRRQNEVSQEVTVSPTMIGVTSFPKYDPISWFSL